MEQCKDIPLFKDLNEKSTIEIQTQNGIVQMIPFRVIRGEGRNKWVVDIQGFCLSEPPIATQCHLFFKGREIGCGFKSVKKIERGWQATMDTIISIPEWWGERQ